MLIDIKFFSSSFLLSTAAVIRRGYVPDTLLDVFLGGSAVEESLAIGGMHASVQTRQYPGRGIQRRGGQLARAAWRGELGCVRKARHCMSAAFFRLSLAPRVMFGAMTIVFLIAVAMT